MRSFHHSDPVADALAFLIQHGFVAFHGSEDRIKKYLEAVVNSAKKRNIKTTGRWHEVGKNTGEVTDCFYYIYNWERFPLEDENSKRQLNAMLDSVK
ncbi:MULTISPECIES: hypothetical protein [unclassified Vibrio]|uniref:hypothetical protein n=1 Tax=unclassified Vibrio TaxID=2614977 RepID=UPI001268968B|nr:MULTISPECIES: hypothetical protein [unclassified Vibrio]QFT35232.1 hypothetical protein FIU99_02175 [Vibrio sp. THAF64]QGM33131.1 hypothetical protein GGC04_02180 [Vibrio sp. THAF191d]QGN68633.1 hypothetical protein GGC03_02175 [Vibrio sp. THAF191c]